MIREATYRVEIRLADHYDWVIWDSDLSNDEAHEMAGHRRRAGLLVRIVEEPS